MKKTYSLLKHAAVLLLFFFLGYSQASAYAYAEAGDYEGEVSLLPEDAEEWSAIESGLELSEGDKIQTGEDSRVELSFSIGHEIRLEAESLMEITGLGKSTGMELFIGELFSSVEKLEADGKYQVKTPHSIVSVRGTEFTVIVTEDPDETIVKVDEGEVEVEEIKNGEKVVVPAGYFSTIKEGAAPSAPRELSELGRREDVDDTDDMAKKDDDADKTDEEETDEVSEADIPDDEDIAEVFEEEVTEDADLEDVVTEISRELRDEIRSAIDEINVEVGDAQDTIDEKRETDVSTGRSMKDRWGNLVRVEQHLMRPDSKTFQFVNITKRDNYKYRGRMGGDDTGSRMDTFQTKIGFNMDIPEKISGWINFISDLEDSDKDFHPEFLDLRLSNNSDEIRVFSDKWLGEDEGLEEPTVTFESGLYDGLWTVDTDPPDEFCEGSPIGQEPHEDSIQIWGISPKIRLEHDGDEGPIEDMRIGMEGWLIDNDGRVVGKRTLEDGNPFDLMNRIALQSSLTFRHAFEPDYILDGTDVEENDSNRQIALEGFNDARNFFEKNFDNILTPDIVYNVLEELASDIDFDSLEDDKE